MRFRFVHAADLHLDSPMRGLSVRDPRLASLFAGATRRAFTALVDRVIELKAAFLIISGDVYDGDWKDHGTGLFFARELARLARHEIPAILVRGNHDAESIITRSLTLPEGVTTFSTRKAETLALERWQTAVHGRSFAGQAVTENVALAYPPPRAGWLNIGVLHTSCEGSPEHATYAPCSIADLTSRGYDYWALGHVHDHRILQQQPAIVFPGNIQGRHARETGAKGAVVVDVADGQVLSVERLIVDVARWARIEVDAAGADRVDEVVQRIAAAFGALESAAEGRPLAVRVAVTGVTAAHRRMLADRAAFAAEVEAAADRVSGQLFVEKILIETRPPAAAPADADALLDPAALLGAAGDDAALAAAIEEALSEIGHRLPEDVRTALADLHGADRAALLAEARDLIIGRLGEGRA